MASQKLPQASANRGLIIYYKKTCSEVGHRFTLGAASNRPLTQKCRIAQFSALFTSGHVNYHESISEADAIASTLDLVTSDVPSCPRKVSLELAKEMPAPLIVQLRAITTKPLAPCTADASIQGNVS
jgi:hypothetical protein